jgi:hypothetical protein
LTGPIKKNNKNTLRIPGKVENKRKVTPFVDKYRKELLAGAIAVLIALIIIILTSSGGGTADNNTTAPQNQTVKIPTKVYSAGGIYLEYPASWNVTTDKVNKSNTQIVIQDSASASNPNSTQLAAVTIDKIQKEPNETPEHVKNSLIQILTNSGANIALTNTTNTTVNGINATEVIYAGNGPQYKSIQLKVIYFEQNNVIYSLAFLTKGTDLQTQAPYFNVILNSFRIQ